MLPHRIHRQCYITLPQAGDAKTCHGSRLLSMHPLRHCTRHQHAAAGYPTAFASETTTRHGTDARAVRSPNQQAFTLGRVLSSPPCPVSPPPPRSGSGREQPMPGFLGNRRFVRQGSCLSCPSHPATPPPFRREMRPIWCASCRRYRRGTEAETQGEWSSIGFLHAFRFLRAVSKRSSPALRGISASSFRGGQGYLSRVPIGTSLQSPPCGCAHDGKERLLVGHRQSRSVHSPPPLLPELAIGALPGSCLIGALLSASLLSALGGWWKTRPGGIARKRSPASSCPSATPSGSGAGIRREFGQRAPAGCAPALR